MYLNLFLTCGVTIGVGFLLGVLFALIRNGARADQISNDAFTSHIESIYTRDEDYDG